MTTKDYEAIAEDLKQRVNGPDQTADRAMIDRLAEAAKGGSTEAQNALTQVYAKHYPTKISA